jgi:hypothetical protein
MKPTRPSSPRQPRRLSDWIWTLLFLTVAAGVVYLLGWVIAVEAQEQDPAFDPFPVTLEVEFSHDRAVPGQEIWASWDVTKGAELVTTCRRRTAIDDGKFVGTTTVQKRESGRKMTMPSSATSAYWLSVECFYPDPAGELDLEGNVRRVSTIVPASVEATTREAVMDGTPSCYPAPIGSGSRPYATTFKDPEGAPVSCALWFCGLETRSFCFRWSSADLSVSALVAAGDKAGLDAKWLGAPWVAMSKFERAEVQKLYEQGLAELPPTPPPPAYVVAKNASYGTRPVYRTSSSGSLVNATDRRVAVGAACDCAARVGTSNYCSVAGAENALKPPDLLPADSFAICALAPAP